MFYGVHDYFPLGLTKRIDASPFRFFLSPCFACLQLGGSRPSTHRDTCLALDVSGASAASTFSHSHLKSFTEAAIECKIDDGINDTVHKHHHNRNEEAVVFLELGGKSKDTRHLKHEQWQRANIEHDNKDDHHL